MNRTAQAFTTFTKALTNLESAMALSEDKEENRDAALLAFLRVQGASWKAFGWVLDDKIGIEVLGPKPVLQEAFSLGWLGTDDQLWLDMVKDRNFMVHNYDQEEMTKIYHRVKRYVVALRQAHDLLIAKHPDLQA